MQNSIRQNAVESIQVGVEDFKNGSHSRIISSIRNIYAGLLLLYKSKLSELSPPDSDEVLIKDKIQPKINDDGKLNWIGKGSKTVDVQQIIDRFKNLNISIDDKTLLKIQKKRNDLEHYYLNGISIDTLKGIIADSFILIRDFTEKYLNLRTVALLGEQTYSILSEVAKFYNDELELCKKEISEFNNITDTLKEALFDFTCEKCGSGLVTVDDKNEKRFVCKSCNTKIEFDKIVPEALSQYNYPIAYESKGMDTNIIDCPFCGEFAYVLESEICELCGESAESECSNCGDQILPEELSDDGLCGWCRHMISKREDE